MPHLNLRYSDNLKEKDFGDFFAEAHELLANSLGVKISSCRSIATICERYFIGSGNVNKAFANLEMRIKRCQSKEVMDLAGMQLLELLKQHLAKFEEELEVKASVEVCEVSPHYFS